MKIHLPKLLCAAIMASFALPAMADDEATEQPLYINIGQGSSFVELDATAEPDSTITIGTGDKVGYLTGDNKFANPYAGTTNYANSLAVKGNLTIENQGEVYVTGKQSGAAYSCLRVDGQVTVNGSSDSFMNLRASGAQLRKLHISGGKVELHTGGTDFSQGNSYLAYHEWGNTWLNASMYNSIGCPKQVNIVEELKLEGGNLKIGCDSVKNSYLKSGHYTTSFGSGTSSLELVQTKGKMEVYGFSIAKSGLSITQTGGTILLRDVLNISGKDENVITQGQVSDATKAELTVGQFTGQTATITMNQTGKGTINLAYGSSFTKDGTINVNQTDAGEINIGGGHKEGVSTTNTYDTVFPGFVAENTTYNIKQTGSGTVHIKSNAAITTDTVNVGTNATLNVDGSIIIKGTATLNGTVNVGATATFELAESCNMSVSTELELSSGNSIRFGIGSVSDADGSMQMSTTGDLAFAGGKLELWLTDDALWEMAEGADALGSEYHLTLISNLSDTDMLELDSVINDELVLSRYYKELELPTTYDVSSALPITIEANSLILENNALKAIAIATNPNLTVPEPTTATLSLLALVGLASRRRRK